MLLTLMGSWVVPYVACSHSGVGTPAQPRCSPVTDGATHQGQAQILMCKQMQVCALCVPLCGGGTLICEEWSHTGGGVGSVVVGELC